MKIYFVPGINGLGKTKGVEKNEILLKNFEFEKLSLTSDNIKLQLDEIHNFFNELDDEKKLIVGGDHSISYPICKTFFEKYGNNSKLVIFDAHPDLMKPMKEPTHEEWLRAVVEFGFNPENILVIGVRRKSENIDGREIKYANKKKIKIIYSDEFVKKEKEILEFLSNGKIYLSFDADAFDSSIISSTTYPETGGLLEKEIFEFFKKAISLKTIQYFDLVEINLEKGNFEDKEKTINIAKNLIELFFNFS